MFYTRREVRTLGVRHSYTLFVDDLVSAYEVREDCDGDGEFERMWMLMNMHCTRLKRDRRRLGPTLLRFEESYPVGVSSFPLGVQSVEVTGVNGVIGRFRCSLTRTSTTTGVTSVTKASRSFSLDDTQACEGW